MHSQQHTAGYNLLSGSRGLALLCAAMCALFVAGCGGGGGGGSRDSDPLPPPPPPPPSTPTSTLSIGIVGQGAVQTDDQMIMCSSDCAREVTQGETVTINAMPAADFEFNFWQGDCQGTDASCTLVVDSNKAAVASFKQRSTGEPNGPPVAKISGDSSGVVLQPLQLSGVESTDPENDPLTFRWSVQSSAIGSNPVLSSPDQDRTSFEADLPGIYVISLIVNDGTQDSVAAIRAIGVSSAFNGMPVAVISGDSAGLVGTQLQLSGAQSTDPENDALTFRWSVLSSVSGSIPVLSPTDQETVSFEANLPGSYVISLTVNDGEQDSIAATRTVELGTTPGEPPNNPPVAVISGDSAGMVDMPLQLSGAQSTDPDNDPLTFRWSVVSSVSGSSPVLSAPDQASTGFEADLPGIYFVSLTVNDGLQDSIAAIRAIELSPAANDEPVAVITGEAAGVVDTPVQLSGAQSSDPDSDPLTFSWTVSSSVSGSNPVLSEPNGERTSFEADLPGTYVVALVVNDGQQDSAPALHSIELSVAADGEPVAVITGESAGEVDVPLSLSGAQSTDPDDDPLTFSWSVSSSVSGSSPVLSEPNGERTSFEADLPGTYVVSLVVNDGQQDSAPVSHSIELSSGGNQMPVAVITGQSVGAVDTLLQLSGAQSTDAENDPLTFSWSVVSSVSGSTPVLSSPNQAETDFMADLAGVYVISLTVNDGQQDSVPATKSIGLSIPGPDGIGPQSTWPHAPVACKGTPDVYYGCTEPVSGAVPDCDDANANGTPDIVEGTGKPHFWYDPLGAPADIDPNGGNYGDQLDAAVDALDNGGTVAIIGRGVSNPYIMAALQPSQPTERTAFVNSAINGNFEICGVEEIAVFQAEIPSSALIGTSDAPVAIRVFDQGDMVFRNVGFIGIKITWDPSDALSLVEYNNFSHQDLKGECPLMGEDLNQRDGNKTQLVPLFGGRYSISGAGGAYDDPITILRIHYKDSLIKDCDLASSHHVVYYNFSGCFLHAENTQFIGNGQSEAFRWLCRASYLHNNLFQNITDWPPTSAGTGGYVNDYSSDSTWVFDKNIFNIVSSGGQTRGVSASRSRRYRTGSSLPNQYNGSDMVSDPYAGNDNYDAYDNVWWDGGDVPQAFVDLLTAPINTDEWPHNGKVWDRSFWREVTEQPWRPDQRVLTLAGGHTGCDLGDTITGVSSGAKGYIWKISGNELHVLLADGGYMKSHVVGKEFQNPESVSGDGCSGTTSSTAVVSAQQLATNEHLFTKYYSNNIFNAVCLSPPCIRTHPFFSHGTTPGTNGPGPSSSNRYLILPLDTDADQYPGDGYDTEATPGDGWVERTLFMSLNNSYVGDWTTDASGNIELLPAILPKMNFNDGDYDLEVWSQTSAAGPTADSSTPPEAITGDASRSHPTFAVDLGGTAETPLAMPAWWPQGATASDLCQMLGRRYGNDPDDPDDYHWWDEPGAETGHPDIDHDGFPWAACP